MRTFLTPERLTDGRSTSYAWGVSTAPRIGRSAISHGGTDAGFRSHLLHFPREQLTVAIVSNASIAMVALADQLAAACLSPAAAAPLAAAAFPASANRFVGLYAHPSGTFARVERDAGKLFLTRSGNAKAQIMWRTDGSFDLGHPEALAFKAKRTANGDVSEIEEIVPTGPSSWYRRWADQAPPPDDLSAYAGRYRSVELECDYTIKAEDGGLCLSGLRRDEPTMFSRVSTDRFDSDDPVLANLTFERIGGSVSSFFISSPRMWRVRFDRLDGR